MNPYTVVTFDREEREPFVRVAACLTIAYPDQRMEEPEPRAVRALAAKGTDVTHALALKARVALIRQRAICGQERHIEYWTRALSTTEEPITEDTPGGGLVTNPWAACQALAIAREQQYQDAADALAVLTRALRIVTPRAETLIPA